MLTIDIHVPDSSRHTYPSSYRQLCFKVAHLFSALVLTSFSERVVVLCTERNLVSTGTSFKFLSRPAARSHGRRRSRCR